MTSASIIWWLGKFSFLYPLPLLVVLAAAMGAAGVEIPNAGEVDYPGFTALWSMSWGDLARMFMSGMMGGMMGVFSIFATPGRFVMQMFGVKGWASVAFGLPFSWAIWTMAISWGLQSFGVYDPFREWKWPDALAGLWVEVRDWIEMVTRWGKGPTAKWAGLPDMAVARWTPGDVFLGRPWTIFGGLHYPVGIATEKHMVTIAGTGAGKSTGALIPNLCIHEGSLLCIDPKGELARITAQRRENMGQRVRILDPFGIGGHPKLRTSYNPFTEMTAAASVDPARAVSYAGKIAEALVRPMSEQDSYWDTAAKTLITGLVLYIFAHEPKEKRTLIRLRELLTEGDVEGFEAAVASGDINTGKDKAEHLTPYDFLIVKMKFVRREAYGEAIARAAGAIGMMSEGQRGSVVTTAQEHTAFLDNPMMAEVLKDSDFALDDLRMGRTSVYVCLPITAVSGPEGRWLRMLVLLFIEMMTRYSTHAPNPPVLLAIDEFPNLGRLDGIELVAPMLRSYGVRFWAVGQDIAQFADVYPKTWTSIIGGAECVQFMGLTHPSTVDFIVERLGLHEFRQLDGKEKVAALLDRDQVSRFLAKAKSTQIIWFGSRRPMRLKICPYYEYLPPWYYTPDREEHFFRRMLREAELIFGRR